MPALMLAPRRRRRYAAVVAAIFAAAVGRLLPRVVCHYTPAMPPRHADADYITIIAIT